MISPTRPERYQELFGCVDRIVPAEYRSPPATGLPGSSSDDLTRLFAGTRPVSSRAAEGEADESGATPATRAALLKDFKWAPGTVIYCRFLDGSPALRSKVEEKAHTWEQFANIRFQFIRAGEAQVRISFTPDYRSWSALGKDALNEAYFPRYQPTMNFGWLSEDTSDEEYSRVVLHEFGHALGLIHEHQNPNVRLDWNREEVFRYYSGAPNFWAPEDIERNVLGRYSPDATEASAFDEDSIMLYMFPGRLFVGGVGTNSNTQLSAQDKEFIARVYPRT